MNEGVGIENSRVIDFVLQDPQTNEFVIIMFEKRAWDGSQERLDQIQRKINNYLFFIMDGQIAKYYPHAMDKPFRIQLDCHQMPDSITLKFLDGMKTVLAKEGIKFVIKVL